MSDSMNKADGATAEASKRGYEDSWPPVRGDYIIGNPAAGVAVVTLASQVFARESLDARTVRGAAMIGPCVTENLGVEKVVANIISNSNIRFLLVCGAESKGHLPGNTILALHRNGIDDQGRIVGSRGAIPFIQNLPPEAVKRFQEQVELVDRIGLEEKAEIERLIEEYNALARPYPEEPFQVFRRRIRPELAAAGEGDLTFGEGVVADTSSWLVFSEV
ncbi:MAG: Tetrahydromethanopterin S-methyltransferase subunit A 1 [Methanosaeta sp. PtaU1.Bin060]|nr:MAG: Tetrahydromethanopterin S-methyltransferase subunit A 1 [Methanosaeta sp. PtaU1.Bin060]